MRLADFILQNIEPILAEWETFARGLSPGAKMNSLALRDHAEDILRATVRDMNSTQSVAQQSGKSRGQGGNGDSSIALNGASDLHAVGRLGSGFDLMEVISEYRALRASVLRLWDDSRPDPHDCHSGDVTRFNESIDQSLCKAVSSYTRRIDQSRDMFLAILSHDLRNPLNSISVSADLLARLAQADTASIGGCAAQISTNASVMNRMISDLLDYTRTRLGAGMPVSPTPIDLAELARELFHQFRTAHPDRQIRFQTDGDMTGRWDVDRLRQAISNLLGNAVQHGDHHAPIELRLSGDTTDPSGAPAVQIATPGGSSAFAPDTSDPSGAPAVQIVVYNGGPPIPPGELSRIFDPLVRGSGAKQPKSNRPGSIGLGLYIAREIARSHGGSLDVTSSADAGTAFTMTLPRHPVSASNSPILDQAHVNTM